MPSYLINVIFRSKLYLRHLKKSFHLLSYNIYGTADKVQAAVSELSYVVQYLAVVGKVLAFKEQFNATEVNKVIEKFYLQLVTL